MKTIWILVACSLFTVPLPLVANDALDRAMVVISQSGPGAKGAQDARLARDHIATLGPDILPRLLQAMDTTNVVAANWFRTIFDEISDRELAKSNPLLPRQEIEEFLKDSKRTGRARRLALDLLERNEPTIRERLMPDWLDDPEFRREAIDSVLAVGDKARDDQQPKIAQELFEKGFQNARDSDQVLLAVSKLKTVGVDVDPSRHMGFIIYWYVIGPFPAPQTSGFSTAFPPEKRVDLNADYESSDGKHIRWKYHQTANSLGEVNLVQALEPVDEAVGYAFTELNSPREQRVQLRCSADDNISVWINGQQVLAREQWLNGTRLDRFIATVTLREGTNQVLAKVCQGPQHVNPEITNNWTFQLRFCDDTGRAIELQNLLTGQTQ